MGELDQSHGTVSDAQCFSLHDGLGLRTCLFFKGCRIHLSRYHTLGRAKHAALCLDYPMGGVSPLKFEATEAFADLVRSFGLSVSVGG